MQDPLPEGWTAHQDAEGRTFYANVAGESTWSKPEPSLPVGWCAHQDPEGRTYYANTLTSETTWLHPGVTVISQAPAAATGTTALASAFIIQLTDMPEMQHAIGEPHNRQLRQRASDINEDIREGSGDVQGFVSDLVFDTIALPLVSPLVAEAIVAAFAAVAGLMEPGILPGGGAIEANGVIEVLEDNAKLVDNLSPYLFSFLCRANAAAASGHSDAFTRRTQVALSGACVWLLAAICRAVGYSRFTAEALWEWANGDPLWVAVLVKGILTLDELIPGVPDTPLKGALIPSDLAQLQDAVAGAVFGLIGSSIAFAEAVAVLNLTDAVDEVSAPHVKFVTHWAKLAVAFGESELFGALLRSVEGPASSRRSQLAGFLARLLQCELSQEPHWIASFPSAPVVLEAARAAAASVRSCLEAPQHSHRLWALLASVPSTSTGRIARSFVKDCCELAWRLPVPAVECANLIRGCLADRSMEPSTWASLCVLAANAAVGPCEAGNDGGLCATLRLLQPDAREQVSRHVAEWTGPVDQTSQGTWLAFLQCAHQPVSSWRNDSPMTTAIPLGLEHCRALGLGGLKELLNGAPQDLCCCLDRQLLTNPVRSPYGHAFEYSVIASALIQTGDACPITGQPLLMADCQHDWSLKRRADNHIALWARNKPSRQLSC